ncbi:type II toxin-antitoxin system RelE/ParE family toxin [Nitrincola sp. MINF-07-Sa-05]|uniref:type II toxin-antitoxin system RelE/ParE family toxin n=1 Tax=Nitrincola salilacus TaxID=3400273 RepID=UPI0039182F3C
MRVEWSPLALEQVSDIAEHIALDNLVAAEAWVEGIFQCVDRLRPHPRSGRKMPELGIDRIREVIYGAYRVIYGIDECKNKVTVLTVRRGSELIKPDELKSEGT